MAKKIGRHRISPQKMKELEGFEDVLDLVYEERPTVKKSPEANSQTFETMAYLEEEEDRLRKMEVIFSGAIPNATDHPQEDFALAEIQDYRDMLLGELVTDLSKVGSALNRNLESFFKTLFPKD